MLGSEKFTLAMHDAKEYALKKPCYSLERELLNTTGALRVLDEKRAYLKIKSASGIPVTNGQCFPMLLFYQNPANGEAKWFCPFILFFKAYGTDLYDEKRFCRWSLFNSLSEWPTLLHHPPPICLTMRFLRQIVIMANEQLISGLCARHGAKPWTCLFSTNA